MSLPALTVEIAFATDPGSAPTWTDVSQYVRSDPLPGAATDCIAYDRTFTDSARNNICEPGSGFPTPQYRNRKKGRVYPLSAPQYQSDIIAPPKPEVFFSGHYFPGFETVKRFRPFARRRDITRRPVAVCMRLRNPCARARFLRDGW